MIFNGCTCACRGAQHRGGETLHICPFLSVQTILGWTRKHKPTTFLHLFSAISARTILMSSHDSILSTHLSLIHKEKITSFALASDCYHCSSTRIGSDGTPAPCGRTILEVLYPVKLGRAFSPHRSRQERSTLTFPRGQHTTFQTL